MENPIAAIKNVSKSFGRQQVVRNINLDIKPGEIFGLLGPSGAGKTTIVRQLIGLDTPTEGEIWLFGERMPSLKLVEKAGYMSQSDALYNELSAKDNLEFFAALYGLKGRKRQERIRDAMELVQLGGDINKQVSAYSGGMKRRLSLAAAMLHEPGLLILDEPTVGIDPVLRKSIWDQFYTLKEKGTAILVTTHVMDEAEKCDRLGMLRNGELIAIGSPMELMSETQANTIEQAFLVYGGAFQ